MLVRTTLSRWPNCTQLPDFAGEPITDRSLSSGSIAPRFTRPDAREVARGTSTSAESSATSQSVWDTLNCARSDEEDGMWSQRNRQHVAPKGRLTSTGMSAARLGEQRFVRVR